MASNSKGGWTRTEHSINGNSLFTHPTEGTAIEESHMHLRELSQDEQNIADLLLTPRQD